MKFSQLCLILEDGPFVDPEINVKDETREVENYVIKHAHEKFVFKYNNEIYNVYLENVTNYYKRYILMHQKEFAGRIDIDRKNARVEGKYMPQIVHVENDPNHKGIIRAFLQNYLIKKYNVLCSDYQQSPMGRKMWEKIFEQNPNNIWAFDEGDPKELLIKVKSKQHFQELYDRNTDDIFFVWKK